MASLRQENVLMSSYHLQVDFPDNSVGKESACNAEDPIKLLGCEDTLENG